MFVLLLCLRQGLLGISTANATVLIELKRRAWCIYTSFHDNRTTFVLFIALLFIAKNLVVTVVSGRVSCQSSVVRTTIKDCFVSNMTITLGNELLFLTRPRLSSRILCLGSPLRLLHLQHL